VKGLSETSFAPGAQITREQMAVMLDSFAAAYAVPLPQAAAAPAFADAAAVSEWSAEAVGRIIRAGVMNGMPDGSFAPQGSATRAQAAKVVWGFCQIQALSPQGSAGAPAQEPAEESPGLSEILF
jgi:hypothetical protein